MKRLLILCALVAGIVALPGGASAAPGDFVGGVTFSQDCGGPLGLGVGVAYDGAGHLWVSCYNSNPDLLRADATTGVVDQTYNIEGGLGALAYDATRNALWAGPGCGSSPAVWLISLDATKSVTGSAPQFTPGLSGCLDDGIAYDASNDTLYYSPDGSVLIEHDNTNGTTASPTFGWTGSGCYNSGLAIGGHLLFQGSDGCSHVWVVDKTTLAPAFDFSTQVAGDPNFRDEGLSCDTQTFAGIGKQVMWSKEAYSPNRAHAYEIPAGTCGVGGRPATKADLGITKTAFPDPAVVGGNVTYTLTVTNNGPDPSSGGTVTDTLPGNVSYVSDDDGCTNTAGTLTCPTGSLANGASQVIHVVVTATAAGSTSNTACVKGADEDDNNANDCATATSQIYTFAPGGGAFVIGNKNSSNGTSVTFWGAQWWKLNGLTGGAAPAAFKGFAENPAIPACGTGWSTDPGNSTPPPAGPLPAFMAVIVTSSSSKSGSQISGNTVHIVIVQTNPGYQNDPGHAGTGKVVAQVC